MNISEGTSLRKAVKRQYAPVRQNMTSKRWTLWRRSVVSPLGFGIRSLTQLGTPVMADETEITLFRSAIPGPRHHGHEYGDGNRDQMIVI